MQYFGDRSDVNLIAKGTKQMVQLDTQNNRSNRGIYRSKIVVEAKKDNFIISKSA